MTDARQRELVLASASPHRSELLGLLGLSFRVQAANVDESFEAGLPPAKVAEMLSLRKARAIRERPDVIGGRRIIIGSDTIVVLEGRILGKPADPEDAVGMLKALQGHGHEVYSGVAVIDEAGGTEQSGHRRTLVRMKPLAEAQIRRYVDTGEPLDKAGGYGIQGRGALLVDGIEGDYYNVVGLPIVLLAELLESIGLRVL